MHIKKKGRTKKAFAEEEYSITDKSNLAKGEKSKSLTEEVVDFQIKITQESQTLLYNVLKDYFIDDNDKSIMASFSTLFDGVSTPTRPIKMGIKPSLLVHLFKHLHKKNQIVSSVLTHGKRKKHISVRMEDFISFELHGFVGTF